MLKIKNILLAGNLFCWVPDIAASQTTCTPGPLLPRDVAGQLKPRLKIKLPEWCPSLVSFRFGLRPNQSSTKPQRWHSMARGGLPYVVPGAGGWSTVAREPSEQPLLRGTPTSLLHLKQEHGGRRAWGVLQMSTHLTARQLILNNSAGPVFPHGERCKDHEPFWDPKRDVHTRDRVCGRGNHPDSPPLGEGSQGGGGTAQQHPPCPGTPKPPALPVAPRARAAQGEHRQDFSAQQKAVCLLILRVLCMISTRSFAQQSALVPDLASTHRQMAVDGQASPLPRGLQRHGRAGALRSNSPSALQHLVSLLQEEPWARALPRPFRAVSPEPCCILPLFSHRSPLPCVQHTREKLSDRTTKPTIKHWAGPQLVCGSSTAVSN